MLDNQYNERATVQLKGIPTDVDADLLFELGTQFGQVVRVTIPGKKLGMDASLMAQQPGREAAYIEFASPDDAIYMTEVLKQSTSPLTLFGRTIGASWRGEQRAGRDAADALLDIGARIVISNLNRSMVDVDHLRAHFAQFGRLAVPPTITSDGNDTNTCTATVSFAHFEGSDAAISATHNQFLFGNRVTAEYAMREDGDGRHGGEEERRLYTQGGGHQGAAILYQQKRQQELQQAQERRQAAQAQADGPDWARGLNPFKQL